MPNPYRHHRGGNIPTPVGKTPPRRRLPCRRRKHPHACGEDKCGWRETNRTEETSPRLWGRPQIFNLALMGGRNIPTPVGKTMTLTTTEKTVRKHPHACGEDGTKKKKLSSQRETSPRLWGRQQYINFFQTATTIFCGPFNSRFLKIHQKSCYFFS